MKKLAALKNSGTTDIEASQVWVADTCGGGGHGDPRARDPQAVLNDVRDGFVTVGAAEQTYGVVVVKTDDENGFRIDEAKTRTLRGTA